MQVSPSVLEIVGKPRDDEAIEFGGWGHGLLAAKHYYTKVNKATLTKKWKLPILFSLLSREIGPLKGQKKASEAATSDEASSEEKGEEVIAIIPQLAAAPSNYCSGPRTWFQAVLKAIDSISSKDVIPEFLHFLGKFIWDDKISSFERMLRIPYNSSGIFPGFLAFLSSLSHIILKSIFFFNFSEFFVEIPDFSGLFSSQFLPNVLFRMLHWPLEAHLKLWLDPWIEAAKKEKKLSLLSIP